MELTKLRKLKIIELISEFKKSQTYTLYKTDFNKIVNDKSESKTIAEILIYKLKLVKYATKETYRLTENGIVFSSFEELESEKAKIIMNSFNNSTIGQLNQSDELSVLKTEIKQTIHPTPKDIKQNPIISFIVKCWWQILVPLTIVIIGILIERGVIDIGI
jgi:hypothetical protein